MVINIPWPFLSGEARQNIVHFPDLRTERETYGRLVLVLIDVIPVRQTVSLKLHFYVDTVIEYNNCIIDFIFIIVVEIATL